MEILSELISLDVLIALLVGTIGGMVIGALPGLSANMGVALLLPVTYGMEPISALVMLAATYTSAIFGGSFTAILIHTPGTPSSASTARDGYEMTLQGRGLEAIGLSTVSSVFGGVFSAVMLLLIAPPLARMALNFSAPENFWIAIFGLTIIGSLAGGDLLKGFISGAFGLILSAIGLEQSTATMRYTFGIIELQAGIPLIPTMIGLFSISQIMIQAERISKGEGMGKGQITTDGIKFGKKFFPTFKEYMGHLVNLIRSAVLGLLIGILPGAGGDIGCWVGYNEAKRFSKHPEKFGHGSEEGVVASETANNAVTGGSFIPLFALGIPGSGTAAIMLGAMTIHGLTPGMQLFTRNTNIIYPIIIGFLVANILMGIIGWVVAKQAVKITNIPMNILTPLIVVLALVGAYAINFRMFDLTLMLIFGIIGYFMRKFNFPTAPIVLALILGPMAENSLYSITGMARNQNLLIYFLGRPICVVFIVLAILAIFAPIFMKRVRKEKVETLSEDD